MARFNLRRIARPDELKAIGHDHLLALLTPHREFFAGRGVTLPLPRSVNGMPYDELAGIFVAPAADTPQSLVDALYHIHGMATPAAMADLLREAKAAGIKLDDGDNVAPADVAVQVWLKAPDLLERRYTEIAFSNRRSFEYFHTDRSPIPPFRTPSLAQIEALQEDLDDWFSEKHRGRGCRVTIHLGSDGEHRFFIRHGDAVRREGVMEEKGETSIVFRPAKTDVLSYNAERGELCANGAPADREVYRKKFGLHLFGDERFFPGDGKYTLEPLQRDRERSLVCTDIDGMEWVRLKEVRYSWGGTQGEVEIRKAKDVFMALTERRCSLPDDAQLLQASFQVKFTDSKSARVVTIKPSNIAEYIRDGDGTVVEEWLCQRGFIVMRNIKKPEGSHALVAGA